MLHDDRFPYTTASFSARTVNVSFILKRQYVDFRIVLTSTPADAGLKAAVRIPVTGCCTAGDLVPTRRRASGGANEGGDSHRVKPSFLDNVFLIVNNHHLLSSSHLH